MDSSSSSVRKLSSHRPPPPSTPPKPIHSDDEGPIHDVSTSPSASQTATPTSSRKASILNTIRKVKKSASRTSLMDGKKDSSPVPSPIAIPGSSGSTSSSSPASPTNGSPPVSPSSRTSTPMSPLASPRLRKHGGGPRRYRRVPMGDLHEAFLQMLLTVSCGGPTFLATKHLQRMETVTVKGKKLKCGESVSDEVVLEWFKALVEGGGQLVPGVKVVSPDTLPLARSAWDAIVLRGHQFKRYDEAALQGVSPSDIAVEARRFFSEKEILRLDGSESSKLPRDRFNPFTHSPSDTVSFQSRGVLANYRIPYLLVNLTMMLLRLGGLEEEGIFRISAENQALENMKRFIVTENWAEIAACEDVHVITGAIKSYFSTMTGGALLTDSKKLIELGPNCDWPQVEQYLLTVAPCNLDILWWWVCLCRLIAAYEHVSSMGLKQLGVCWAPCLVRQDLSGSSGLQSISAGNAVIQHVISCILANHPRHSLSPKTPSIDPSSNWFPVTAETFFQSYIKPRDPSMGEDFIELEEQYGRRVLLDAKNNFQELVELLDLIPNAAANDAADSLFYYLWKRQCFFKFVEILAEREVAQTKTLNSLFRLNSVLTKLLKSFAGLEGGPFLKNVLSPLIRDLSRTNTEMNYATASDDAEKRARIMALSEACSMSLCTIMNSSSEVPSSFQIVSQILASKASARWSDQADEAGSFAVSSFFFLRFLCPFFLTSTASTPGNASFTMKAIAKVLQAMVNGQELRQEEWPEIQTDLVVVHTPKLKQFLTNISSRPSNTLTVDYSTVSEDDAIDGFEAFIKLLRTTLPQEQLPPELADPSKP